MKITGQGAKFFAFGQALLYPLFMDKALFAWIGNTDLRAAEGVSGAGVGPIAQALAKDQYAEVHLLNDHAASACKAYCRWLRAQSDTELVIHTAKLDSPTDFRQIFERASVLLQRFSEEHRTSPMQMVFHLSPGTPAMAAIWLLLGKTLYPAELIESSVQSGVRRVDVPFDIHAEYLPRMIDASDARAMELAQAPVPSTPEFGAIQHRCDEMKKVVARARHIALHDVPVLILGESGTGKELFARAIHSASPRRERRFVSVNCGAIPSELVESEFFGHRKGAFTGAIADKPGYLEEASGGTLLLDEVGELPLPAQVKLLRALQAGEIQKVGDTRPVKVDIRVISATNRNLLQEVASGRFREDLFHRLAVGVLHLPPLRERPGDLSLLTDRIMGEINDRCQNVPGWKKKEISAGARKRVSQHAWPGNVRELVNTLSRAAIWCRGETISADDLRDALLTMPINGRGQEAILNRDLGGGFSLPEVINEVACHYLERALCETRGNKTRAAELVGLPSYQTLTNWLARHGIRDDVAW